MGQAIETEGWRHVEVPVRRVVPSSGLQTHSWYLDLSLISSSTSHGVGKPWAGKSVTEPRPPQRYRGMEHGTDQPGGPHAPCLRGARPRCGSTAGGSGAAYTRIFLCPPKLPTSAQHMRKVLGAMRRLWRSAAAAAAASALPLACAVLLCQPAHGASTPSAADRVARPSRQGAHRRCWPAPPRLLASRRSRRPPAAACPRHAARAQRNS